MRLEHFFAAKVKACFYVLIASVLLFCESLPKKCKKPKRANGVVATIKTLNAHRPMGAGCSNVKF
jgi:hypothetical protein